MTDVALATARAALAAGVAVIPILTDGTKRPPLSWKPYQSSMPTPEDIERWFSGKNDYGLAVVAGSVSGNLEILDFDEPATYETFVETAKRLRLDDLLNRIRDGYEERTPTGGTHLAYRCSEIAGNTKLAERFDPEDSSKREVLIETRGEGGYAIVWPSGGGVHESGRAWQLSSGGVDTIVTITPDERQVLHDLCRSFNAIPPTEGGDRHAQVTLLDISRPGDDFRAQHGDLAGWRSILEPHGWTYLFTRADGTSYWRRPGKGHDWSATSGYAGTDLLYMFSSSTALEPSRAYNPFAAYAMLNHGGDFSAAARALRDAGFGRQGIGSGLNFEDANDPVESRPFPSHCLPPALRHLVEEAEATLGIPAGFVATPGLAVLGAALGNKLQLKVKEGWTEPPALFTAIVGDPGSAKSPALDLVCEPLSAIQTSLKEAWEIDRQQWQEKPAKERGPEPVMRVIKTTDTTIEGLCKLLERSRGVLCSHDELTSWISGHTRYRGTSGSERSQWLSLWAGSQLVVSRAGSGTIVIDRPAVSLIGGIQPDLLHSLAGAHPEHFCNDGMFDRFLVAWPIAEPSPWTEEEIDEWTRREWGNLVTRLWYWHPPLPPEAHHARPGYSTIRLSPKAMEPWATWFNENCVAVATAAGPTKGWAAKAPRHLGRIVLILHAAKYPTNPEREIDVETLEEAIEIVEWFREQHGLMLSRLNLGAASAPAGLTSRILRIVRQANSEGQWASRTDIRRGLGNRVDNDALTRALTNLVESAELEFRTVTTASKPREEYAIAGYPYAQSQFSHFLPDTLRNVRKGESAQGVPVITEAPWWCGCGEQNADGRDSCWACGSNRATNVEAWA